MATQGIVTILFTDLVGSTELLERLGDDAAEAVRRTHFQLLREAAAASGGIEVKSLGDGLMLVFPSALDAIGCAVAVQQAVELHNQEPGSDHLSIRVGLHAGEPIREEDDYFGTAVVVAKRLCDSAEGGQIVASDLVRALVGSRGAFSFREMGDLDLKGLASPLAACEIVWQGMAQIPRAVQGAETSTSRLGSPRSPASRSPTITRVGGRRFGLWVLTGTALLALVGIVAAVIVIAGIPGGQDQADRQEITLGEARFGSIVRRGEIDTWVFHADAGEIITIDVTASGADPFDPFLELSGPTDAVLAFVDYGSLDKLLLPEAGRYTVRVRTLTGLQVGDYRIQLTSEPGGDVEALTEPPGGQGTIEPGQTGFGTLTEVGEVDSWVFEATSGQVVSIGVTLIDNDDPFLQLAGPDDTILAFHEDGALYRILLPLEGGYTAHVGGADGSRTGVYGIFVSSESTTQAEATIETPGGQNPIELGESGFGAIRGPGEVDTWTFQAAAEQVVTISITSSVVDPFEPFVELVGPAGSALFASDDEYHEGVLLRRSGAYSVRIMSSDGVQTGLYRIDLE